MSDEKPEVASYRFFADTILPRIAKLGYNTVQLMAIQEHPYYGSFGYHVSSFFAPSSRFGSPEDLKYLIDTAHKLGLYIILDIVHSHAVKNELEGLSRFDGTTTQYFHAGDKGTHQAWDSRVFDYGKPEVAHFLLSNLRFWLDEYHFDGFRFDGVTSMLYHDHGLERSFGSYDDYVSENIDIDALTYLTMANKLIHSIRPDALTIAEDMSAFPGIAAPIPVGGIGFDYRLSMGVPDLWIKLLKEKRDEDWDLGNLLYELQSHRPEERTISYAESHDQALVGDKTLMFRLIDKAMYDHMQIDDPNLIVERGIALHKMIRLVTATTHHGGYLNFMGNEFGHPEWIDFPREGNAWSYHHARRQWSLADNARLKYRFLQAFDTAFVNLLPDLSSDISYLTIDQDRRLVSYSRGDYLFVYNFSPEASYVDQAIPAPPGAYDLILSSDDASYGGQDRVSANQPYEAKAERLLVYIPARTCLVFKRTS
jgi:1,4-alpha-glucan branching enzyme